MTDWNREEWGSLVSAFPALSLYQTWDYAQRHSPGRHRTVLRAVLGENDELRALGQMRVKRLPLLKAGTAELEWGPLYRSLHDLGLFLVELRKEVVERRGIELRVHPRSTYQEEDDAELVRSIESAGFARDEAERPYQTNVIDLSPDLEDLQRGLHSSWRRQLRKSQASGLSIEEGASVDFFDRFSAVYGEMWESKQFITGVRHSIIRELVASCPKGEGFRISIAVLEGKDVGASVCAEWGDTVLYFLGASSPDLRSDCAPGHLLHWNNLVRAKDQGFAWYDLGGIVDSGEGVNRFKRGMGGKEVVFPGCFVASPGGWAPKVYHLIEDSYQGLRRLIRRR